MATPATKLTPSLFLLPLIVVLFLVEPSKSSSVNITPEQKRELRAKSVEMFYHAYNSYMNNAYPADELMPLTCKGRSRGTEPSRGDIDDTLGNFTLTLIDTLDTLAVLGDLEGFEKAVRNVIRDSRFDADIVVSVFETNIRILGGLLGGHVAASYFKKKNISMQWYRDELLTMAKEVGDRLLPAFNTTTGIPYPRVNLKHGITPNIASGYRDTCTSCAGTMILEFAALSRLTGISVYEEKTRKAMDYLWTQRHRSNNLMGMVINIHNGDWVRRESGVGAGIDSYYEYVLKAYVLLGDDAYLSRFNKHYDAVMRYISQGPMLVDVHMHKPTSIAKNFMDSLLAFWPGLQVLVGDIGPAVETHEMLYQIVQRHNFLPEAFTTDFRIHWGQHLLRPEFLESTYFLYQATADPYYLAVGKTVLENLEQHTRVQCGFAAIKDVKTNALEDQMDSFVLAETFKYLYLLFSEKEDIIIDLDDFIFTTEAHLLPLSLSIGNYTWKVSPKVHPDIYKFDMMSVAEMTKLADDEASLDSGSGYDESRGVCHNYHVTNSEGSGYPHKLRHQLRDLVDRAHPKIQSNPQRLKAVDFVAGNKDHLDILRDMGIRIATMPDGRIQLLHTSSEAVSTAHADAGLLFMQEMIELSKLQKQDSQHEPMFIRLISYPFNGQTVYKAGPSQFGYELNKNPPIRGSLAVARPFKACTEIENGHEIAGKITIIERGDCMFVDKARHLQNKGAIGGIVLDQAQGSSSELLSLFAMSGDGTNDVTIPVVFLFWKQGRDLLDAFENNPNLIVELTSKESASDLGPDVPTPSIASSDNLIELSASSALPSCSQTNVVETGSTTASSPSASAPPLSGRTADFSGILSKSGHAFYHHDFMDVTTRKYFLQAGTKFFHLNVEVSSREDGDLDENSRNMKYDPLPDGSKMFTFYLRYRFSGFEKPNLNEMYLDVIHSLQHHTNFEQFEQSADYKKAIARFMESAFFSIDRIDSDSLEVMFQFVKLINVRHTFPGGESVFIGKSVHLKERPDTEALQDGTPVHDFKVSNNNPSPSSVSQIGAQDNSKQEINAEKENFGEVKNENSNQQLQEHHGQDGVSQEQQSHKPILGSHQHDSHKHHIHQHDSHKHQNQHEDVHEQHLSQQPDSHQSQQYESHGHQSHQHDSQDHQGQKHDSLEYQGQKHDSQEHQSHQLGSQGHQSHQHDSQEHQSRQESSHEHLSHLPDSQKHIEHHQNSRLDHDSHLEHSQDPHHEDPHKHHSTDEQSSHHEDPHKHHSTDEQSSHNIYIEASQYLPNLEQSSSVPSDLSDKSTSTVQSSLPDKNFHENLGKNIENTNSDFKSHSFEDVPLKNLIESPLTSFSSTNDDLGKNEDVPKEEL